MPLTTRANRPLAARVRPLDLLLLTVFLSLPLVAGAAPKPAPGQTAAAAVQVKKSAPTVEEKTLDPRKPPPDMARLAPGHKAFTHCYFSLSWYTRDKLVGEPRRTGETFEADITLERIDVTLDLRTTIWLPADVSAALREHEAGHRRIGERFYGTAEADAKRLAAPWVGRTLTGRGPTAEAAQQAAREKFGDALLKAYLAVVKEEGQKVHDLYDRITRHGDEKVGVDEAVRLGFERRAAERKREAERAKPKRPTSPAGVGR